MPRSKSHPPWPSGGIIVHATASGVMAPPAGAGSLYLPQEHVALRAADARSIVVSYARPLGNFRGEVRLARITFR
ncbi:MAG: hypothetical protein WCJ30_02155 [Deltaproteobacteria bacterium]